MMSYRAPPVYDNGEIRANEGLLRIS